MDGPGDAIKLAGPAFHADLWPDQYGLAAIHLESRMRADIRAHAAAVAQLRFVNERIFQVSIQHG
jgi:hypothetical protein